MTPPCPNEHEEQKKLIDWADTVGVARWPDICRVENVRVTATLEAKRRMFPLIAIPNGGDRHPAVAAKLKAEGVRRGVPDLLLAVGRQPPWITHGLWIEMKRRRGGRVSPDQAAWHEYLERAGYRVVVARGADEAIAAIEEYLG